ncbi:hypothetical protein LDENG_00221990, partial [Lucifuga dentata]
HEQRRAILVQSCFKQETAVVASLHVVWILAKRQKPFTDSETERGHNSCFGGEKIPMSDTTTMRRVELLSIDVFQSLLEKLRQAEAMSLAVDESTDGSNIAQLCLCMRLYDGECFRENLLELIPLEGHTAGEIIFQKDEFFNENGLGLQQVNMLLTDGALFHGRKGAGAVHLPGCTCTTDEIFTLPAIAKCSLCQTQQ